LLVPLLVLAGRPLSVLVHYALPLAVALTVYALASRIPGSRAPPEEDERTAPLSENDLLGRQGPIFLPSLKPPPTEPAPPPQGPSSEMR
jgi:hypothetical protein